LFFQVRQNVLDDASIIWRYSNKK